jgi:SAM-dependent methyltransferase
MPGKVGANVRYRTNRCIPFFRGVIREPRLEIEQFSIFEELAMARESAMPRLRPIGAVLHSAVFYDAIVWLALRGRERQLRQRLLDLCRLQSGEAVLDVACGTGTLAILAKKTVGRSGTVCGVDASPEMLARARSKAARAGVEIRFENAAAQALPFPDATFDLALGTMMLHHLGRSRPARTCRGVAQGRQARGPGVPR